MSAQDQPLSWRQVPRAVILGAAVVLPAVTCALSTLWREQVTAATVALVLVVWVVAAAATGDRVAGVVAAWGLLLGRELGIGRVAVGVRADLAVLDASSYAHLAYRPGVPLARSLSVGSGGVVVQVVGVGGVAASVGRGPGADALGGHGHGPAAVVFEPVMGPA